MATQDDSGAPASTFTWGAGGARLTPEEIAARRKVADALMAQGTDASPLPTGTRGAGVWTQGLARVAKGISAGLDYRQADTAAKANDDDNKQMIAALLGGGGAPSAAVGPVASASDAPAAAVAAAPAPVAVAAPGTPAASLDPETTGYIKSAADRYGVDPAYLSRTAMIESGGKSDATNTKSGAAGLFQFMPRTAKEYGLDNPLDPEDSAMAAAELAADNRASLKAALGRDPTNAELYLAHQQGADGASKLLANPNARAVDVLGQQAVVNNGGTPDMTAGQFASKWIGKYGPDAAPTAAVPVRVATNGPVIEPSTPVPDPTDIAPAGVAKVASAMPPAADDPAALPANATPTQGFAVPGQPAAPAAASASGGVAKVSSALGGVNPAVLQAVTSPYASESTKKIAGIILQQQLTQQKVAAPYNDPNLGIVQRGADGTVHVLRPPQAGEAYSDPNLGTVQRGPDGALHVLRPPQAGEAYKDADGNLLQKGPDGSLHSVIKADSDPSSVKEYQFYQKNLPAGQPPMDYASWSTAKARAAATNVTTNIGGENKGMEEAQKLDAEAVRKGQNEQVPALEDADHNFQLMQAAIERNGGKLPTGGQLGKMGLDWNRTKDYIAQNWGIDLGSDPNTTTSLETFNKGGIKAAGEMAKAIGGSRVLKTEFDMAQKANPGLETSDGGNKYLLDVNRNGIAIKRDYFQAQEDYWRAHNHSLDGFQKNWNEDIHNNPRPLSSFAVAPPVDNGDGTQMVKLPSTAKGGYSWYQKGPNGTAVVSDPAITSQLESAAKPLAPAPAAPAEKIVGGKTYIKQDGNWFEKH